MFQPASIFKGKRTEVPTAEEGSVPNVPDASRNKHFLESTVFETAVSDGLEV